jgi:hypothetical protein
MSAVIASLGVLGLCLLALPDDTATALVALAAIVGAIVSIAFLVTASSRVTGPTPRARTRLLATSFVERTRPRLVPLVDALGGAPVGPALAVDGGALLPAPYRLVQPGHHRRREVVVQPRAARAPAGLESSTPWHDRVRSTRSIWVLIAIVYVYLALFALVVVLNILD